MEQIKIAFAVEIEGNQFTEVEFQDTIPEFRNIELKPRNKDSYTDYNILVLKNKYSNDDDHMKSLFNEAYFEADNFKYRLSIAADIKIYNFNCIGYYSYNNDLENFVSIREIFPHGCTVGRPTLTVVNGELSIKAIKEKLKKSYDMTLVKMYVDASTLIEPISRFVSLYTLLLHYSDDKQKTVDMEILKVDPTIGQFKSPISRSYETVFTKLRNEIAHKRDDVSLLDTYNNIKLNVSRFESIVKLIILKKLEES